MNCPVCNQPLSEQPGNQIHPGDPKFGMTVYCANPKCSAAEVAGHGSTSKEAFSIVNQKFEKRKSNE
jgi:hypothetical protein